MADQIISLFLYALRQPKINIIYCKIMLELVIPTAKAVREIVVVPLKSKKEMRTDDEKGYLSNMESSGTSRF